MPKDEALNDPQGDFQDLLVTAAYDYITEHGLPTNASDMSWIADPNYEDIIAAYAAGSGGFSTDDWLRMIDDIQNVHLEPDGHGGFDVHFDFHFEDESGDYSGSRSV